MRDFVIRDVRAKEKFQIDDYYLNGYAKVLRPATTAVYVSLCRHADLNQKSFPSIGKIANQHAISISTVQRALRKLVSFNIIRKERTRTEVGKWLNNTYFLLDKSVWKTTTGHPRPMVKPQVISEETTGHQRPTKDTHNKDTHNNNPSIVSPNGDSQKNYRPANRLAGKSYSKPEWLLNLSDEDVVYFQEDFIQLTAEEIRKEARSSYYWQKDKGRWKKDNRSFLRKWLRNQEKWSQEKVGSGITYQE